MTTIPTITDLPTPPQTSDPTNFDTRADAFLAALDDPFVAEVNAFAAAANTVAGEVQTNATNASTSATNAASSASTASTQASNASTSATNAAASESAAATSATNAATSEANAATSASALSANANSYRTVDYVATSNVAISTALANGQTLDGGTLATGQRVILTAQTTGSENGIYDVPASGAASRSSDSNSATLMPSGITVAVTRGTLGKSTSWLHTTDPGFTLGTTTLTFLKRNALPALDGVIDGSDPAAGKVGEPFKITKLSGAASALTNNVALDIVSKTLHAGIWELEGNAAFTAQASTSITDMILWIGTGSATIPTFPDDTTAYARAGGFSKTGLTGYNFGPTGRVRVNITGDTAFYLGTRVSFSGGTLSVYGAMTIRRIG